MESILRFTRVGVALALGLLFLLSQRSNSSDRVGPLAGDARETALSVVRALERLESDCGKSVANRLPDDLAALVGEGTAPLRAPSPVRDTRALLTENGFGIEGWSGPYLEALEADPWGHAFVVTVVGYTDRRQRVWVLSAGPNGRLETTARDTAPHGDDVALLARW